MGIALHTKNAKEFKGRGAQTQTQNPYAKLKYVQEHLEMLDEPLLARKETRHQFENPKKIINKVSSPDIPMDLSMNPYQGCEHGCVYCYARNTHQYWGYSAGLDFERVIIVKENAPQLLRKQLNQKNWVPKPIMFSGNTDCYQPAERKLKITRKMLEVLLEYRHPVGMITKNNLILRDLDLLTEMASLNLVKVAISVTTLNEALRQNLEPRTSTGQNRIKTIQQLAKNGIPVSVMVAPIIPGLNHYEIPEILKQSAAAGAQNAAYTLVRLNGAVADIFEDWISRCYPDRAEKVLSQIRSLHGGKLSDSRFGSRMRGEGNIADSIRQLFRLQRDKYFPPVDNVPLNTNLFRQPPKNGQLSLF